MVLAMGVQGVQVQAGADKPDEYFFAGVGHWKTVVRLGRQIGDDRVGNGVRHRPAVLEPADGPAVGRVDGGDLAKPYGLVLFDVDLGEEHEVFAVVGGRYVGECPSADGSGGSGNRGVEADRTDHDRAHQPHLHL